MDISFLKNAKNIKGKRALIRVDVNVPIIDGSVRDDFRIGRVIPTLLSLAKDADKIILLSHHSDESQSLEPIARYLHSRIPTVFVKDIFNAREYNHRGVIFLCENLRFYKEEKNNDSVFAERLASLGDIYINEAFSVSHRNHASVVSVPRLLPHYAGFLFEEEITNLAASFNPAKPFLLILGGRKADTKLRLAEKFIDIADHIFIGGAAVHTLFKARGNEIGTSLVDEVSGSFDRLLHSKNIIMPDDVVVEKKNGEVMQKDLGDVLPDEKILDAGPKTVARLNDLIRASAHIVWNGPLGQYERGFKESTIEMIGAFKTSNAKTIVGGGDTIAAISKFGNVRDFDFVSTGGGAMLDFLIHRTLPGIEALKAGIRNKE